MQLLCWCLSAQSKRRKELEEQKMQLVMEAERHRMEISARQVNRVRGA